MNDQLLSIQEAAKFLDVATKTLRRWEARGVIVTKKTPGGHRRYSLISLKQFKQLKGEKRINKNSPIIKHPFEKAQNFSTTEVSFLQTSSIPQTNIQNYSSNSSHHSGLLPADLQQLQAGDTESPSNEIPESSSEQALKQVQDDNNYDKELSDLPQNRNNHHVIKGFITAVIILFFVTTGWYMTNDSAPLYGGLKRFFSSSNQSNEQKPHLSPIDQVLAATTLDEILFRVNVRSEFSKHANFGEGLTINGDFVATGSSSFTGDIAIDGDVGITGTLEVGTINLTTANITNLVIGGDTLTELVGTGLTLSGTTLTTSLGTDITSTEIVDGTIVEADLNASNAASGNQVLTYNSSTGGFTWATDQVGTNLFTDGGDITYLTATTDDFALGGSTTAAPFFFDVSTGNMTFNSSSFTTALTLFDTDTSFDAGDTGIIDAINTAYNAATGGGGGLWTLTSGVIHPTTATHDVTVGGTSLTASIFGIDESAGTFYFGYDNSANPTLQFEATDGDAGTLSFGTSDAFTLSSAHLILTATNSNESNHTISGQETFTDGGGFLNFDSNFSFSSGTASGFGAEFYAHANASTTGRMSGLYIDSQIESGSTSLAGLSGGEFVTRADQAGSTITDIRNMYSRPLVTGGTITNLYNLHATGNLITGGTITNRYGIYIEDAAGGTITNNYGLYIASHTSGSTDYALYSAGGANYFGGNIGVGSGTNVSPTVDLGADLGTSSLRWNNLYVANINSNSTSSFTGQAIFTYEPTTTNYNQSSVMINPTSPLANSYLLGIGVGGLQSAGIDEDGDLAIGYASAGTNIGALSNPLNVYGHSTTAVMSVDTSGNITTIDNAWIGLGSGSGRLEFDDQGTDEINFLSSVVGIGTQTPATLLNLSSSSPTLRIDSASAGTGSLLHIDASGWQTELKQYGNSSSTTYAGIASSSTTGALGVLRAYGPLIISSDHPSQANPLVFATSNGTATISERMRVNSDGTIGIGTTAPDAALEINHATGDSLRLTYNDSNGSATNYTDFSLASDGDLTIDSAGGAISLASGDDFNLTAATDLIFGGATSLGETTAANDSGAYLVGTFDEFDNSASANVQDVLDDLDAAITSGGGSAIWTLGSGVIYPTSATNDFAIGGATLAASIFSIDESTGTFLFGGDQSANATLTFEATDSDTANITFNTSDTFDISGGYVDINNFVAMGDQGTIDTSRVLNIREVFTDTSGTLYGTYSNAWAANGSDSSASFIGAFGYGLIDSGVSSNITGAVYGTSGFANHVGTGTVSLAYGVASQVDKGSTGPITTAYSLYSLIRNTNATGAITNAYGLYIADSVETGTITNDYGVYQVDTGAMNYFGGNVGIGVTSPQYDLHLAGSSEIHIGTNNDCNNDLCIDESGIDTFFDYTITNHNGGSLFLIAEGEIGLGTATPAGYVEIDTLTGSLVALTIDQDDVDQTALDFDVNNTAADILNIDWGGATTQTAALSGIDVDFTNLTTVAGSTTYGIHINDPAAQTTSTEYAIYQEGTNWDYGLYVDDAAHFASPITVEPNATGTFLDFELATEWTSGTLINADWASSTTQTGNVTGTMLDFTTFNIANGNRIVGHQVTLTSSNHNTSTRDMSGIIISGGALITSGTATTTWQAVDLAVPDITQTAGSLTAEGIEISNGAITTGGTVNLIDLAAAGVGAGTLTGINMGNITAGAGTERAMYIGTGWDTDLGFADTTPTISIGDTGTLTITDGTNTLLTLADSSNAGNLSVTGTYTASVFNNANSTALCWDNSGASEITDCSGGPTADYAETYPTASNVGYGEIVVSTENTKSIDVVETDKEGNPLPAQQRSIAVLDKSTTPYAENIIGVTSQNYNDFSSTGRNQVKPEDHPLPVALSGRVPVKVDVNSDPILIGDYLTSSATGGHAMRAKQAGRVIGMALEKWTPPPAGGSGQTTVMVFVNPTWYAPNLQTALDQTSQMNTNLANLTTIVNSLDQKINGSDFGPTNIETSPEPSASPVNQTIADIQGQIETMNEKQNTFENELSDLKESLAKTEERLAKLEPLNASDSAYLNNVTMQQFNNDTEATLSSLLVSGTTNLNNVSVTGTLTNGLLALNGMDGQINALGSTLYLQSHGLGGIDLVNGKVKIDESGNVEIAGAIKGSSNTRGIDVTVEKDKKELKVEFENSRSTTSYAVSVTPNWETSVFVAEKKDDGFTVKFASPAPENSKVDWIVIE